MKEYFIWLLKALTLIVLVFAIGPLLLVSVIAGSQQALSHRVPGDDRNRVAVVELTGMIDSSKEIVAELHRQIDNENIKGVVLRINTPGGAVAPSQDIYNAVKRLKERKPIVASMESVAASGGLYSALGASRVLCQPGTLTGSIGVIMQIPNFQEITDKLGVDVITVKSGALKDVGNSFRPMTPEEQDFLQQTVSRVHEDFILAVVEGRGIPREKVESFADGRIILGSQAKELNLVDGFGGVYDAARAVFEILGEPLDADETPELIYAEDKFSNFKKLFESITRLPGITSPSVELKYLMH